MSYLIFCSFEVGGLPFKMAETLNRFGFETYYIYLGKKKTGHDSTQFHYGTPVEEWDISFEFQDIIGSSRKVIDKLRELKNRYQFSHCLATGGNVYLLRKAGINYKYWSYGGDLDYQCFAHTKLVNNIIKGKLKINPVRLFIEMVNARRSIEWADSVMISSYQLECLKKICPGKPLFFLPHCIKLKDYNEIREEKIKNIETLSRKFQAAQYFFSSTRHVWVGDQRNLYDNKRNDIVLKAYAQYLASKQDNHSKLILVEKGAHIEASHKLSRKLGIERNIAWVREMPRPELDRYYQASKICFGQFGTPAITYSILEPLASGSVGISFCGETNPIVPFYKTVPPIFNDRNPENIAVIMAKILQDQARMDELSYGSWSWIRENCSEENFVESFLNLFAAQ